MLEQRTSLKQLYELDYPLWIQETADRLRHRRLNDLDWEHLIEEIEDLGREQRHKVDSYLKQLFIHLLLYQYWTQEKERCGAGWRGEIANFRDELEWLFESKTLYNYCLERFDKNYSKARKQVIINTQLSPKIFPELCPFTIEQILDAEFFPE